MQIIDYKGINSVNEFATEYLKYKAPQKINRLKKGDAKPSYDIITDIVNTFEDINPLWLLTGKGDMVIENKPINPKSITDNEAETAYERMPRVVTTESDGRNNIILVPVRAAAGYLNGYGDPEFIETLPTYSLPNIQNGVYRMFQVNGHSMFPTLHNGAYVVGQFVENWVKDIKDDRVYIIVSKNDGIIVKRCLNRIKKYNNIYCKSDNRKEYPSFAIEPADVIQVWEYKMHLGFELSNPADLYDRVSDLEAEVFFLKGKMS